MPKLGVVIASVREGRVGRPISDWFVDHARRHGHFEIDVIDLKTVNLPIFAEPHQSRRENTGSRFQICWRREASS